MKNKNPKKIIHFIDLKIKNYYEKLECNYSEKYL